MVSNNSMHQGLISKEKERGNLEVMRQAQVSVSVMRQPPRWGNVGFEFPVAQLKTSFAEPTASKGLSPAVATEPTGKATNNATHFNLLSDYHKIQGNEVGRAATSLDYEGFHELEFGQTRVYEYPIQKQALWELVSPRGSQFGGRMMLPLDLSSDDGPIFVNAKQYHGILRRRQSRANDELKNKLAKQRKPFMHMSRHLHAKRRARGSGGRFLNTKKLNGDDGTTNKKKMIHKKGKIYQPTGSQNSEVVQSNGTNIGSMEGINVIGRMTYNSGSEVTSIFSGQGCYDFFSLSHPWQSPEPMRNISNSGQATLVLATKWVAATEDRCCNVDT